MAARERTGSKVSLSSVGRAHTAISRMHNTNRPRTASKTRSRSVGKSSKPRELPPIRRNKIAPDATKRAHPAGALTTADPGSEAGTAADGSATVVISPHPIYNGHRASDESPNAGDSERNPELNAPIGGAVRYSHRTAVLRAHRLEVSSRNVYFLLLELRGRTLFVLAAMTYLISAIIFALILLPLEADIVSAEGLTDYPPFEKTLYCSLGLLLSLGYGDLMPVSSAATAVCTFEQFFALMLGALVISLILSKFMQPLEDMVFSNKVLITTRDLKPVLLFRIGNLRCNRVYFPEIRVTHVEPNVTMEGELHSYFTALDPPFTPPSMAGCFTVCVPLTQANLPSSLQTVVDSLTVDAGTTSLPVGAALTVVLRGMDSVLGAEITAFHRYGYDDIVAGPYQFGDVMNMDGRINFQMFHEIARHKLKDDTIMAPKMDVPDHVYVLNGAIPFHGEMIKSCMYSQKIEMLLKTGEVPHTIVNVNFKRKPNWFFRYSPDGTTPVVIHNSDVHQGSEFIIGWVQRVFTENLACMPSKAIASHAEDAVLAVSSGMEEWVDKEPGSEGCEVARSTFVDALDRLASALGSHAFLCGDVLGVEDAILFPQFESAVQYVEILFDFDLPATSPHLADYRARMYATEAWQAICPPLGLLKRLRCERLCSKMVDRCPWLRKLGAGLQEQAHASALGNTTDEEAGQQGSAVELCM